MLRGLGDLLLQPGDDRLGRAAGAKKPFQPRSSMLGKPSSRTVGTSGRAARALAGERRQRLQGAGLDVRERGRELVAAELDAAGDEFLHQRRGAAERHVVHGDAGVALIDLVGEIHDAAGPGRAVEERLLAGLSFA